MRSTRQRPPEPEARGEILTPSTRGEILIQRRQKWAQATAELRDLGTIARLIRETAPGTSAAPRISAPRICGRPSANKHPAAVRFDLPSTGRINMCALVTGASAPARRIAEARSFLHEIFNHQRKLTARGLYSVPAEAQRQRPPATLLGSAQDTTTAAVDR